MQVSSNLQSRCADIIALDYHTSSEVWFTLISKLNAPVWLDSGKPKSHLGRFDILCADPRAIFKYDSKEHPDNFIDTLNTYLTRHKKAQPDTSDLPENPFCGGFIGCLDYAFLHQRFKLKSNKASLASTQVGFYEWTIVQDHKLKTCHLIFMQDVPQEKRRCIKKRLLPTSAQSLEAQSRFNTHFFVDSWQQDQSKSTYIANLKKINRYIHQGDTYQVNYTQRFSTNLKGNPAAAYLTLRQSVPSPYSAFIDLSTHHILSVSPEQFIGIKVSSRLSAQDTVFIAETKPIKGTVKRDKDKIVDKKNAQSLQKSIKNRSENVMIVDLLRNDFSQNCKVNSVKTPKLFNLESYENVHHLVSTVTGVLKPRVSPLAFMIDCYPGGSITGAPKKRAMEIIDELEPHERQVYCGTIFYQSLCGELDSSICIRTMVHDRATRKLYCWGGGGIVSDSKIEEEYQESFDKVQALMTSLAQTINNN